MVVGFHFIISAYGFWLPNDPRGSWSSTVRQFDLLKYGPATKIQTTQSVADTPHDRELRHVAKRVMKYPPVKFTGLQARAIARGFAEASSTHHYQFHALAILPDHAHLVMAHHDRPVDKIAAHLKAKATMQLSQENLHPMERFKKADGSKPSPWARNYWCPFIRSPEHLQTAVDYVEKNPMKAGLRQQHWRSVVPYG